MQKTIFLFVFLFTLMKFANAQTHIETFATCGKSFTIHCEPQDDNSIKVSINDGLSDKTIVQYKIWTTNIEVFASVFEQRFADSSKMSDSCKKLEQSNWLAYGRELLKNYLTAIQNTLPNAGIFKLSDSLFLKQKYFDAKGKLQTATTTNKYKVVRLQADIEDGYLENIVAYVIDSIHSIHDPVRYILPYPIGMSSVNNFKKYKDRLLYFIESSPFIMPTDPKNPQYFIKLSDLINYDYYLGVKRRDYSPKDTAIDITGGTSVVLHKEETKKLFEANMYTDFEGLNESKPNGLVQTDIAKRININTVQYLSKRYLYWLFGSYGYFQYIAPSVSLSKLEQHNKRLNLRDLDSVRLNPGTTDTSLFNKNIHRFANALDLYQFQWFSAGLDLNLFYINNHDLKFTIYLNAGARLGFTEVNDSLTLISSGKITKTGFTNSYTVTSLHLYPEININFFPEERFSVSVVQRWVYFKPYTPSVQLVSYDKNNFSKLSPRSSSWINSSELLMTIQVNPNSKLFGRMRFNWEGSNVRNNFSQIQVGYSTYILGNK